MRVPTRTFMNVNRSSEHTFDHNTTGRILFCVAVRFLLFHTLPTIILYVHSPFQYPVSGNALLFNVIWNQNNEHKNYNIPKLKPDNLGFTKCISAFFDNSYILILFCNIFGFLWTGYSFQTDCSIIVCRQFRFIYFSIVLPSWMRH